MLKAKKGRKPSVASLQRRVKELEAEINRLRNGFTADKNLLLADYNKLKNDRTPRFAEQIEHVVRAWAQSNESFSKALMSLQNQL